VPLLPSSDQKDDIDTYAVQISGERLPKALSDEELEVLRRLRRISRPRKRLGYMKKVLVIPQRKGR